MGECKHSCKSASETLAWINEIVQFLTPYSSLINAHVVNFFKDRLWENVDAEWIECLRGECVQNLLLIPSGALQDQWPTSLKKFILKLRSMVLCQEQADINMALPGLQITSLNSVLAQGMNVKKRHEVEVLSAVINTVANSVRADAIVDVGAGQGYLAQVLAFQYQHPVIAIDACSHHGTVTNARAERIKKHYTSQMKKSGSDMRSLNVPKTITCHVLSIDTLKTLVETSLLGDNYEQSRLKGEIHEDQGKLHWLSDANKMPSTVLAGLHACGDLSVTMLKTFLECKDVKAVVSLGCCYNLLSEEVIKDGESQCGFPMSHALRSTGLSLGKSARDLACQSAERWRSLDMHAGIHNFELHAFRAAFQMDLIGPYWSLRAALGPLLETLILLDRLLFLQKQGSTLEVCLLPIFDPSISPRNVAIIAKKRLTKI